MGQYIQAGICYKIKISKKEMEYSRVSYDNVIEALAQEIQIDLYEVKESETGYVFSLKDEILENGNLLEFLSDQYKMLNVDEDRIKNAMDKLKGLSKADSIIDLAKEKKCENFQYSSVYENIYCTMWRHKVMVNYELIAFMFAGKIIMECYRDFLSYVENIIKKNNSNTVSKTVKVFIG